METKKEEQDIFSGMFAEGSSDLLKGNSPVADADSLDSKLKGAKAKVPYRIKPSPSDEGADAQAMAAARKFFSGAGAPPKGASVKDMWPLVLYQKTLVRQQANWRPAWPLWTNNGHAGNKEKFGDCLSVSTLLCQLIDTASTEEPENKFLSAWAGSIALTLGKDPEIVDNGLEKLKAQLEDLPDKVNLKGPELENFTAQVHAIIKALPVSGALLPFTKRPWLYILQSAIAHHNETCRKDLTTRVKDLAKKLADLLEVEAEKDPERSSAGALKSSMESAGDLLDFDMLSSVVPGTSSEMMPAGRVDRIRKTLEVLKRSDTFFQKQGTLVSVLPGLDKKDATLLPGFELTAPGKEGVFKTSARLYEKIIDEYKDIIAAVRVAELEASNSFDEDRHGSWFDHFDWRQLTDQELAGCPPVVALVDYKEAVAGLFNKLTRRYPVKTVVVQEGPLFGEDAEARHEPGAMAIAMRNTFALQTATSDAAGLYRGFLEGLAAPVPGLFYLLDTPNDGKSDRELWPLVAAESRAFPSFTFSGNISDDWGRRFSIDANPQTEKDWPVFSLEILDEEGAVATYDGACTYADFAAMNAEDAGEFMVYPDERSTEGLLEAAGWLSMKPDNRHSKLPFIWMVDPEGALHRVLVSWKIISRCMERLDFWRYLQDSAGANSYHVNKALSEQKKKIEAATKEEMEKLGAAHKEELEKVKAESAGEAMEKLTAFLLDQDLDSLTVSTTKLPIPIIETSEAEGGPETTEAPAAKEAPVLEEEDDFSSGEPWIETPLCTTCNECTDINKQMFKYNKDKLAYIADPKAGTFAQLVMAAEKCPAKIIHPGKPLNPNEPGLDQLIKEAEKFNT